MRGSQSRTGTVIDAVLAKTLARISLFDPSTVEETAEEIIVEEVQDEGEEAVPDSEDSSIVEEPAQEAHAADAPQEAAEEQE